MALSYRLFSGGVCLVILGIDPGLANTGWGVIETRGSQCRARAYGCVHTDKGLTLPMRLKRIHDEIAEVIMRYSPMEVAVEEIFFCSNAQSAIATNMREPLSIDMLKSGRVKFKTDPISFC